MSHWSRWINVGLCLSFCLQVACSDDDNPTSTDGPGTSVDQGPDQKATDKGVTPADQSQGSQVKSSDGKVTLNIPKGALPSGVSVSDVKITPVAQKDVITSVTGASFLLAYRLTPDGTKCPIRLNHHAIAGNRLTCSPLIPPAPSVRVS